VGLLALLTMVGTGGFMLTEELRFLDALYMAVITLSTVGYQDVAPSTALGRAYTIVFIVVGVGVSFYAVVSMAEYLIEGRLQMALGRRAMDRSIQSLKNHVIVCGYGRLGRVVAHALAGARTDVVVVESDPALEAELDGAGLRFVIGSAIEEDTLKRAGIERARAIVAATSSDPDNVFVALSARELNPEVTIHARGETEPGIRRLRLAGAEQVISLQHIVGQRIANAILRPAVVDFVELSTPGVGATIDMEEIVISPGAGIVDLCVSALADRGVKVSVVAIKRDGEPIRLTPDPDEVLRAGDQIVVVGGREEVEELTALATARA